MNGRKSITTSLEGGLGERNILRILSMALAPWRIGATKSIVCAPLVQHSIEL